MNTQAEEQPDLDGCTFHGVPVEEHIKDEDTKTTQSVYADEIKEKSNPNPVRSKSRFTTPKERNGKVMNIKNRLFNEDPENNYGKCKTVKNLVLSLLLSGDDCSANQIYLTIKEASEWHKQIRNIVGTGSGSYFKIQSVYNALNTITRSNLSKLMQVRKISNQNRGIGQKKTTNCYSLGIEARNMTFEEALVLSKEWPRKKPNLKIKRRKGIPKKTIKKAVKKQKEKREYEQMKSIVEKELKNMMQQFLIRGGEAMEEQYKDVMEAISAEIESLRKDMSTLQSPQSVFKIDIPSSFHFHHTFTYMSEDKK